MRAPTQSAQYDESQCGLVSIAYPAVKIFTLLCLPHSLNVGREDDEESREHSIRLRPARVFGEQVVHDGGSLDNQSGNILQRGRGKADSC